MKLKFIFTILLLLIVDSLLTVPIKAQEINRILAIVDDQIITTLDVGKMLNTLEQQIKTASYSGEHFFLQISYVI